MRISMFNSSKNKDKSKFYLSLKYSFEFLFSADVFSKNSKQSQ